MIRGALSGLLVGALRRPQGAAFGPGSGVGSGLSTALDLNFVAMAVSGVLDPRITFSRGSLATLTDAAGNVAYAPHNLLTRSAVSTTNWSLAANVTVTAGSVADPDGAMTGATIAWGSASAGNGVLKVVSGVNGAANSKAIYVRADVAGGTVELVDPGSTVGSTVATLTTSWQRVSLSEVAGAQAASGGVWLRKTASSPATIYVCWATFNFGPLQPYYPTTGSAYFGPRFTYDPVTHAALGLLIEEQRTNVLLNSEDFSAASWNGGSVTVALAAGTAPNGATTLNKLTANSIVNVSHQRYQIGLTLVSGNKYTGYAWMKQAEYSVGIINIYDTTTGDRKTYFNLATGAVMTLGAGCTATCTAYPGGIYLCTVTRTVAAASGGLSVEFSNADNTPAFAAAVGSGIYAWGAQLEAGAFATTYIPTTSASVTRAADSATMTGANFSSIYNSLEGTVVAESSTAVPNADAVIFGGGSNVFQLRFASLVPKSAERAVIDLVTSGSSLPANTKHKIAATYKTGAQAIYANGALSGTATAAFSASGGTMFGIGSDGPSANSYLNGPIARLRYYPTALTNAQLQTLTT